MGSIQTRQLNGHDFQTFAVAQARQVELSQHEGVLIPHGAPYWFESSSQENLVILRFGAAVPGAGPDRRIDLQRRTFEVTGETGGAPRPIEYVETHSAVESTRSAQ
jgi:hypothetical protein